MNTRIVVCISAVFLLMISGAYALGDSDDTGIIIIGDNGLSLTPVPPIVFIDGEARLWNFTAETENTATVYGYPITNHGYNGTLLPLRQHHMFTGETLRYFIVVMDGNGIADITNVDIIVEDSTNAIVATIPCANIGDFAFTDGFKLVDYSGQPTTYEPLIMASYVCTLTVDAGWTGMHEIYVQAQDATNTVIGIEHDNIFFNPTIDVRIIGGPITFGTVAEGTIAMSSTVTLKNLDTGANVFGSGVLLDMYISSDNYFTSADPSHICPTDAGIPYTAFSYYATKGSVNSGSNINIFPGVGLNDTLLCNADINGFTQLVSETSDVANMCRIINWADTASILAQGAEMSITFRAEVPTPCSGTFNTGRFYFIGEVI